MNELPVEVQNVNHALRFLAEDDDFHDDMKVEEVQRALRFWTREIHLDEDEKEELMSHRRVVSVYGKLRALQAACNRAGMRKVPMEHVLHRQSQLHPKVLREVFGIELEAEVAPSATPPDVVHGQVEDLYDWRAYVRFFVLFLAVFAAVTVSVYVVGGRGSPGEL